MLRVGTFYPYYRGSSCFPSKQMTGHFILLQMETSFHFRTNDENIFLIEGIWDTKRRQLCWVKHTLEVDDRNRTGDPQPRTLWTSCFTTIRPMTLTTLSISINTEWVLTVYKTVLSTLSPSDWTIERSSYVRVLEMSRTTKTLYDNPICSKLKDFFFSFTFFIFFNSSCIILCYVYYKSVINYNKIYLLIFLGEILRYSYRQKQNKNLDTNYDTIFSWWIN